jgi:predicted phosphodiesterase
MKIQILSDLHLEFEYQEFDFTGADILILAGDIYTSFALFLFILLLTLF